MHFTEDFLSFKNFINDGNYQKVYFNKLWPYKLYLDNNNDKKDNKKDDNNNIDIIADKNYNINHIIINNIKDNIDNEIEYDNAILYNNEYPNVEINSDKHLCSIL